MEGFCGNTEALPVLSGLGSDAEAPIERAPGQGCTEHMSLYPYIPDLDK